MRGGDGGVMRVLKSTENKQPASRWLAEARDLTASFMLIGRSKSTTKLWRELSVLVVSWGTYSLRSRNNTPPSKTSAGEPERGHEWNGDDYNDKMIHYSGCSTTKPRDKVSAKTLSTPLIWLITKLYDWSSRAHRRILWLESLVELMKDMGLWSVKTWIQWGEGWR